MAKKDKITSEELLRGIVKEEELAFAVEHYDLLDAEKKEAFYNALLDAKFGTQVRDMILEAEALDMMVKIKI